MKYVNENCRKMKGSHLLLVLCGYCKTEIAKYQKVGRGNLLRMHHERVIESSVDLSNYPSALICPNCNEQLGARMELNDGKIAYSMMRSTYNTKEIR